MGSSPAYTYGEGDIIAGKYGVVEHLGRGGFGEVYLVEIITGMVGEQLALKLLPESVGADDSKRDRFLNEIRLAMKLVDRNIVTTRDVGNCQKGQPYFTMDYCPGRTLAEVVESEAPLELPRAVSLVQTILDGLQAAHDQGIIHRDLKPANFIVEVSDSGEETVKIFDFGIATAFEPDGGRSTKLIGTPNYMAPEQFIGEQVTFASDLYSVGVVLYQLLTDERPYEGDTTRAILDEIQKGEVPPPEELNPDLENYPKIVQVVRRAIEKNPDRRFQSAAEFDAALEEGLAARRVASASSRPRPPSKKRSSASPGQSVALVLGLVVMAFVVWWFLNQLNTPKERPVGPGTQATTSGDRVAELARQGAEAFERGEYGVAVSLLRSAYDAGRTTSELQLMLGEALYLENPGGNREEAKRRLKDADTSRSRAIYRLLDQEEAEQWDYISREVESAKKQWSGDRVLRVFSKKLKKVPERKKKSTKTSVARKSKKPVSTDRDAGSLEKKDTPPEPEPTEDSPPKTVKSEKTGEEDPDPNREVEFAELRKKAEAFRAEGEHGKAEEIYEELVEEGALPGDAFVFASYAYGRSNFEKAYEVAEDALDGDISDERTRFDLALVAARSRLAEASRGSGKKPSSSVKKNLTIAEEILKSSKSWEKRNKLAAELVVLRVRYKALRSGKSADFTELADLVKKADGYSRSPAIDYEHGLSYFLFFQKTREALKTSAASSAAVRLNSWLSKSPPTTAQTVRCHEMLAECRLYLEEWRKARQGFHNASKVLQRIKPPPRGFKRRLAGFYEKEAETYVAWANSKRERLRGKDYGLAIALYKYSFELYPLPKRGWQIVYLYQRIDNQTLACRWVSEKFQTRPSKWKKKWRGKSSYKKIVKFSKKKCR